MISEFDESVFANYSSYQIKNLLFLHVVDFKPY